MAGETADAVEQQEQQEGSQAQTDGEAEAAFSAGFDGAAPTATPDDDPSKPGPKDEDKAAQRDPRADPPAAEAPPEFAQVTRQQLDQLLARSAQVDEIKADNQRRFDAAFGQLGGMKQVMERLQSQTAPGQPVELNAEDMADLSADYPELGERMLKTLQKVAGKMRGTGGQAMDTGAFERMVAERTGTVRKELIDTALDAVLPDWETKVRTPEYATWIDAQPEDVKALQESNAPREAARLLRLYGAHLAKPPAPAPAAKPAITTRQRQLEAAVNPKGSGGHAPARTEEDAFREGFNS